MVVVPAGLEPFEVIGAVEPQTFEPEHWTAEVFPAVVTFVDAEVDGPAHAWFEPGRYPSVGSWSGRPSPR